MKVSLFQSIEEQSNFIRTMVYVGYKNELMKYGGQHSCAYFNKCWAKHYNDLLNDKDVQYISVVESGREVGFFIVRGGESATKLGVDYYIEDVYIYPDFRGRGIMKKFVAEFFRNHSGRYGMELIGENKNATKFWCSVVDTSEWEKIPRTWCDGKTFYFRKGIVSDFCQDKGD